MDSKQVEHNLKIIQVELDKEVSPDDIEEVEKKLSNLSQYMGLSAECCKWSQHIALQKQKKLSSSQEVKDLSPSKLKFWLEGQMADELTLLRYTDRINAALTHCSDSLISILSKYKAELNVVRYSGTPQH